MKKEHFTNDFLHILDGSINEGISLLDHPSVKNTKGCIKICGLDYYAFYKLINNERAAIFNLQIFPYGKNIKTVEPYLSLSDDLYNCLIHLSQINWEHKRFSLKEHDNYTINLSSFLSFRGLGVSQGYRDAYEKLVKRYKNTHHGRFIRRFNSGYFDHLQAEAIRKFYIQRIEITTYPSEYFAGKAMDYAYKTNRSVRDITTMSVSPIDKAKFETGPEFHNLLG